MLKDIARLFIDGLIADGIMDDDYLNKRRKRYEEEVRHGAAVKASEPELEEIKNNATKNKVS